MKRTKKDLSEISAYKKYADSYYLQTKNKAKAIQFFNRVKLDQSGWRTLLCKNSNNEYSIHYLNAGNITNVEVIKEVEYTNHNEFIIR